MIDREAKSCMQERACLIWGIERRPVCGCESMRRSGHQMRCRELGLNPKNNHKILRDLKQAAMDCGKGQEGNKEHL